MSSTNTKDAWDWLISDDIPAVDAIARLKAAEFAAGDDGLVWALIAGTWLDVMRKDGIANARRCLQLAEPMVNYVQGFLAGAGAWLDVASYDRSYLPMAHKWMDMAEADLKSCPCPCDACSCARTWIKFPDKSGHQHAWGVLGYAEQLYEKAKQDSLNPTIRDLRPTPGLLKEYRDDIRRAWSDCFGSVDNRQETR
jgi:hypothetical protein